MPEFANENEETTANQSLNEKPAIAKFRKKLIQEYIEDNNLVELIELRLTNLEIEDVRFYYHMNFL